MCVVRESMSSRRRHHQPRVASTRFPPRRGPEHATSRITSGPNHPGDPMTVPLLMAATDPIVPSGSNAQLILAAIGGIAVIVVLITWLKLHAFLALMIGAIGVGIAAGLGAVPSVAAFAKGFGDTMGGVGILIGLGAMYGKLLADSGGADRIVDTLVSRSSVR